MLFLFQFDGNNNINGYEYSGYSVSYDFDDLLISFSDLTPDSNIYAKEIYIEYTSNSDISLSELSSILSSMLSAHIDGCWFCIKGFCHSILYKHLSPDGGLRWIV